MIKTCAWDETVTVCCDHCGEPLGREFVPTDFSYMIAHAKDEGWSVKPDGEGGWEHLCPDCKPTVGGLAAQRKLFGL